MNIERPFKQWVLLFVLLPFSLFLVAFNLVLWGQVARNHRRELTSVSEGLKSRLESLLATESVRLQNLGALPNVESLLLSMERVRRNALPQRRNQIALVRERWKYLPRDDYAVREVLDNSVGEIFQRLCANEAELLNIILTDADGQVVASARKTESFSLGEEDWWVKSHTRAQAQPISDGFSSRGSLGLSLALQTAQRTNFVIGIIRSELQLGELLAWIEPSTPQEGVCWFVRTDEDSLSREEAPPKELSAGKDGLKVLEPWGWKKGWRYASAPLEAGIYWLKPVHVVAARRESYIPVRVAGTMLASLLLSALALVGVRRLTQETGRKMFFLPYQELLKTAESAAGGNSSVVDAGPALAPTPSSPAGGPGPGGGGPGGPLPVAGACACAPRLQVEDFPDLSETQKDLALAMDFQRACLDRPPPRVPAVHVEGHLRLEFHHRFKPAKRLGGAFFDVLAADQDCAGLFMGGVMDRGTRSAMMVSALRTLIREHSRNARNARFFISELNKAFCRILEGLPDPIASSAFYFVADTTGRAGTYCSAAHPAPWLVRRSSRRISRLETPPPQGAALGKSAQEEYTAGQCRLMDQDVFIFFNEGTCQAANSEGEAFGLDRFQAVLERYSHKGGEELLDRLMRAITGFIGEMPLADDICLVAMEVTSKAGQ